MLKIKQNESLVKYTTFKIGGPAKFFVEVNTAEELVEAVKWTRRRQVSGVASNEKFFVIGGGSNLLVDDKGFDGLVIRLNGKAVEIADNEVKVFAGVSLSAMIRKTIEAGLAGLEFAANIPGAVAGAVRGNAGAYGRGVGDFVEKVEALFVDTMEIKTLTHDECEFSYRDSLFKKKDGIIILNIEFRLPKTDVDADETLKQIQQEWTARQAKQPLEYPSAGCAFVNIEAAKLTNEQRATLKHLIVDGKIAAGCLIEKSGLKGKRIGGAQISEKHANFIVNVDNAKAADVGALIELVKATVQSKFGIVLAAEIQYLNSKSEALNPKQIRN
ncbi:MAG: UDP-N-acetylmuramate dehydrogenase [Candidatus Falkowbacteria bacterium]